MFFFIINFDLCRCPAEIFVGDTLCYFAGMTFAVVGIIGHFSKTMLLFFIPQIVNFLLSIPQLFRFIPCPRHRLPRWDTFFPKIELISVIRLNPELNKLKPSEIEFKKKDLTIVGWLMLRFFSATKFIRYREYKKHDNQMMISTTNFTIINTVLCWCGPLHEETLTRILILIQVRIHIHKERLSNGYFFISDYLWYFADVFHTLLFSSIFLWRMTFVFSYNYNIFFENKIPVLGDQFT